MVVVMVVPSLARRKKPMQKPLIPKLRMWRDKNIVTEATEDMVDTEDTEADMVDMVAVTVAPLLKIPKLRISKDRNIAMGATEDMEDMVDTVVDTEVTEDTVATADIMVNLVVITNF